MPMSKLHLGGNARIWCYHSWSYSQCFYSRYPTLCVVFVEKTCKLAEMPHCGERAWNARCQRIAIWRIVPLAMYYDNRLFFIISLHLAVIFNNRRLRTCHHARELYEWASAFWSHWKLASQRGNKHFWESWVTPLKKAHFFLFGDFLSLSNK